MNYPEADVNWTRISEYKHSPNQPAGVKEYPGTVVYKEYSTDVGDPYYPVPNKRNKDLYLKYQVEIHFVGSFIIFMNMHMLGHVKGREGSQVCGQAGQLQVLQHGSGYP